jgi:hypothetical protein
MMLKENVKDKVKRKFSELTNDGEFLEQLGKYKLLKRDSAL